MLSFKLIKPQTANQYKVMRRTTYKDYKHKQTEKKEMTRSSSWSPWPPEENQDMGGKQVTEEAVIHFKDERKVSRNHLSIIENGPCAGLGSHGTKPSNDR
jgi:hypothetical protein